MKEVNAREFRKSFSRLTTALVHGQTIAITRRGKSLGFYTKALVEASRAQLADFAANLEPVSYSEHAAERVIRLQPETLERG